MAQQVIGGLPDDLRKKYKLNKPDLEKIKVSDFQLLILALMEQRGRKGPKTVARACSTCCCCCAAAVSPD
jgi:hypothetical protein